MARTLAFLILFAASACTRQYSPQQTPSGVYRTTPPVPPPAAAPQQQAPSVSPEPQLQEWHHPDGTTFWGIYDPNTGIMKPSASPQLQEWHKPDGTTFWGIYDANTGIMKILK